METCWNSRIERKIKDELKHKIISKVFNSKNQTELIQIDEKYTPEMFYCQIQDFKDFFIKTLSMEILEKEINEKNERIEELENIEIKLNEKLKANDKLFLTKNKDLDFSNKKANGSNSYAIHLQEELKKRDNKIKELVNKLSIYEENIIESQNVTEEFNANLEEQTNIEFVEEEIVETFNMVQSKINNNKNKSKKIKKNDKDIIARNIKNGKEKHFKTYSDVHLDPDIKIGVHSLHDNYLNKMRQFKGFVFYELGKPYWQPPENFIYYELKKPSIHMQFCKSVEMTTGNILFYNSMLEASWHLSLLYKDFEYCETNRRTLRNACNDVNSNIYPVSLYKWYKCDDFFGSWINI